MDEKPQLVFFAAQKVYRNGTAQKRQATFGARAHLNELPGTHVGKRILLVGETKQGIAFTKLLVGDNFQVENIFFHVIFYINYKGRKFRSNSNGNKT